MKSMITRALDTGNQRTVVTILALLLASCGPARDWDPDEVVPGDITSSSAASSPGVLLTAVKVGEPYKALGNSTAAGCFARSIWDMQAYQGRIYLGSGDYWNNAGPIDVWSLAETTDGTVSLVNEITVDEEMVDHFRVFDGKLFIPGTDSTESWDLGNFYLKSQGTWQKRRTLPGGLHTWDIASFSGNLYAYVGQERRQKLFESNDMGKTWHLVAKKPVFGMLAPMESQLWIFGSCNGGCVHTLDSGVLKTVKSKIYPHTKAITRPRRLTRFADGVLYTAVNLWDLDAPAPLLFLSDLKSGAAVIDLGDDTYRVRDIVVDEQSAYVLTARRDPSAGSYVGVIYESTDLVQWSKRAQFSVPAPPYSFEVLNGTFYVGLGSDGWVNDDTVAEPESGSVWRVE